MRIVTFQGGITPLFFLDYLWVNVMCFNVMCFTAPESEFLTSYYNCNDKLDLARLFAYLYIITIKCH